MKTYHIKDLLKKELLIIELPENGYYEEYRDGIEVRDFLTDEVLTLANYTLLGKPDEIKKEDAEKLVEKDPWVMSFKSYRDYSSKKGVKYNTLITATESLLSAIESEIYWENPLGFEPKNIVTGHGSSNLIELVANSFYQSWKKAQEKTFDKKRVKMFVKN